VLIAATEEQIEEARLRLARVGIEVLGGYLAGGVTAWRDAGLTVARTAQISPEELQRQLQAGNLQVLDVRREPEWDAGHIEQAIWWPLDNFKVSPPELDQAVALAVHCKGGYRSMIASSLLERAGFQNVFNLTGGIDAWQASKLPLVTQITVKA
jgi:rhodanese-related sulfurtransferase